MATLTVRIAAAIMMILPGVCGASLRAQAPGESRDVVVATTTSLQETGLLDSLAPLFERATGYRMRAVAVGSGQALRMGERGDADVLLVHAPAAEEAFMRAGHGVRRRLVATNWFTLVGPADDPAGARGAPSAADALARMRSRGVVFVSRGDSSGTHQRELALWRTAGTAPRWPGYLEAGQGMAATLMIASERRGYTLTDRASFLTLRRRLDLVPLREREAALLNIYHVIELDPAGRPRLNAAGGRAFADFVTSDVARALLARFGTAEFGEPLFVPARDTIAPAPR